MRICINNFAFRHPQRRGTVLVVTLVIVFAIVAMAIVLCQSMKLEIIQTGNYRSEVEALAVERAAEQYVTGLLSEYFTEVNYLPEDYFAAVPVGRGYFWVVRPDYGDPNMASYGLTSEAGKLNINVATYNQLMCLPQFVGYEDVASSILDWRDTDENPTNTMGAEGETYLMLPNPYFCKNNKYETVEELLLVYGMTRNMLYGNQQQMLGFQNYRETSSMGIVTSDQAGMGLYDYLTVCSADPSEAADNTARMNSSSSDLTDFLRNQLGTTRGDAVRNAMSNATNIFDLYTRANMTPDELDAVADYLKLGSTNTQTGGAAGGAAGGSTSTSSTSTTTATQGLIDINTAPREVLFTLMANTSTTSSSIYSTATNALTENDIDLIINSRPITSSAFSSGGVNGAVQVGWFADVMGSKASAVGARLTWRSYQHTAEIIAVSGDGRSFKRYRVIFDCTAKSGTSSSSSSSSTSSTGVTSSGIIGAGSDLEATFKTPRIIYRKDLTSKGWPLDPQIIQDMRDGMGPGDWSSYQGASNRTLGGN